MKTNLARIWKTEHPFTTRDLDNGFFVVSFDDEDDMNMIYQEGPWMFADHYLAVQRWRPNFDPWEAKVQKKIAVWIRIPLLPLEFFNVESLRLIGKLIGRTLKVDMITHTSERGRFARICIEIDLKKKLKSAINVFGRRRVIAYEGLQLVCFHCAKYGHHRNACPDRSTTPEATTDHPGTENAATGIKTGAANVDLNKEPNEMNISPPITQHNIFESGIPKRPQDDQKSGENSDRYNLPAAEGLGAWNLVQRPRGRRFRKPDETGPGVNAQENFKHHNT
ncbi:uncharacterized protein LOC114726901 [Neltuma alba]|uniref:uncharacterized protein LOC114726901 n=1 Tax=Neltuma alba TaxID=207710 RepID=UPI0010A45577|nr:uncharacterized protein LOC114726901 [Prosopis alba]